MDILPNPTSKLHPYEHDGTAYRLSMWLILRMGLPGPRSGEPMLFLRSLVGEGGAAFPICQGQKKQNTVINTITLWGDNKFI